MTLINTLFPKEANNGYQGSKLALYFLVFFVALMTSRSIIHLMLPDGGINLIGNFMVFKHQDNLDPNLVLYGFAHAWGLSQLIFCIVNITVLIRWRNLIPSMYLLWITEWLVRTLIGIFNPLTRDYFVGDTPGITGAPILLFILIIFFLLSLRKAKEA